MKFNNIKTLIFLGALMGGWVWGSQPAQAYDPGNEKHAKSKEEWNKKREAMYKDLGLSQEQQNKLNTQREQRHEQMQALRQKIKTKREEIRQEIEKEDFDVAKVKDIHAELKNLKLQAEDARLQGILEVRAILTPEQFKKFMNKKDEWRGNMHGKKGGEEDNK